MKKLFTLTFALAILFFSGSFAQCSFTPTITVVPASSPGVDYYIIGSAPGVTNGAHFISIPYFGQSFQTDSIFYSFPGSGNYNVCYYVQDSSTFCSDTVCTTITVNGGGATNCNVYISASGNGPNNAWSMTAQPYIAPGWMATYTWNYGDGVTGSGQNTTHTYSNTGSYTVTVTMNAYNPADSSETCTINNSTVINVSSVTCSVQAMLNTQQDTTGSLTYYIYSAVVSGTANASSTLTIQGGGTYSNLNNDTTIYTFPSTGNYSVCYYVQDSTPVNGWCYDTACTIINAGSIQIICSANFTATNNGYGNFNFTSSANVPSGWTTSYNWDFGDGTYGTGNSTNHTYSVSGNYTVHLSVNSFNPNDSTQTCGASDSALVTANTNSATSCYVSLTSMNNGGGSYSYYQNTTSNFIPAQKIFSWTVDGNSGGNDTMLTVTLTGTYTHTICVVVWLIDQLGDTCSATTCVYTTILGSCQAAFVLIQDSLNPTVYYGYNNSTGSNLTYLWDFGDGTTSTLAYPSHSYAVTGVYNICLTVTDTVSLCTNVYCDSAGVFKMMTGMSSVTILGTTVGMEEKKTELEFTVAPNPLTESSTITVFSKENKTLQYSIINLVGQTITNQNLIVSEGKNSFTLNTASLSSGVYFLSVTEKGKLLKNIKLVK